MKEDSWWINSSQGEAHGTPGSGIHWHDGMVQWNKTPSSEVYIDDLLPFKWLSMLFHLEGSNLSINCTRKTAYMYEDWH